MSTDSTPRPRQIRIAFVAVLCLAFASGGSIAQARVERETICHIPPDNPANARTIEVALPAVTDHLAHGDTLGPCPDGDEPPPTSFSTRSVAFDGMDDFVDMGTIYEFVSSNPFSMCFWYKANAPGEAHLMGRQNPGDSRRGYFMHLDSNANVCFSLVANALSFPFAFQRECTATPPALGAWHHVCGTIASGSRTFTTMRIYVDGVEATTNEIGANMENSSFSNNGARFTFGAAVCAAGANCASPFSRPFQGNVDEAAMWASTELNLNQVDELFADGKPTDLASTMLAPAPDSWWRMGECTDGTTTVICDENLGHNFHGVLVNGAMISSDVP